jgi:hypothetical protein
VTLRPIYHWTAKLAIDELRLLGYRVPGLAASQRRRGWLNVPGTAMTDDIAIGAALSNYAIEILSTSPQAFPASTRNRSRCVWSVARICNLSEHPCSHDS